MISTGHCAANAKAAAVLPLAVGPTKASVGGFAPEAWDVADKNAGDTGYFKQTFRNHGFVMDIELTKFLQLALIPPIEIDNLRWC